MRINQDFPDLKTILKKIMNKENFNSKYINENEKLFFFLIMLSPLNFIMAI